MIQYGVANICDPLVQYNLAHDYSKSGSIIQLFLIKYSATSCWTIWTLRTPYRNDYLSWTQVILILSLIRVLRVMIKKLTTWISKYYGFV